MFKKMIRKIARRCNLEIRRINGSECQPEHSAPAPDFASTMPAALRRLQNIGVEPDGIVDVGAAVGAWSSTAMTLWPNAHYLLVEPLQEQIDRMSAIRHQKNVTLRKAVAGNSSEDIEFDVSDDLDGSGIYGRQTTATRKVSQLRLGDETLLQERESLLIKLDTHGYEIPILEGCDQILPKVSALIIEVYGFHVSPTACLFHELSEHLFQAGFRLFDIVDVMRREKDSAFWQADAVFIPSTNHLFLDNEYR